MSPHMLIHKISAGVSVMLLAAACGGGGGGGGSSTPPGGTNPPPAAGSDFDQGVFRNSASFKDICLNPRTGSTDLQGDTEDENYWLRSWSNELYLWYDEIVDEDPADFDTPEYFDLMRTFATTPSGRDRDQFHFTFDTEEWEALSQSGISVEYGARIILLSTTVPREAAIAYVVPGSPADTAGLVRGDRIIEVDGFDLVNSTDPDPLNDGLFPDVVGESHTFLIESSGGGTRSVTLSAANVTEDPVPVSQIINTSSGPVGYLVFTTHIETAEQRLFSEFQSMSAAGVTDLILDLRYNGGGLLDIANETAFMVAGPAAAGGRTFEEIIFNDKHPTTNPVTGGALTPRLFHQVAQGFSVSRGTSLPSVNLPRVFILTTEDTCSASEAIINGLVGIDFEVILIGTDTCGKPFGFYPTDNCGTTYFTIQFQGVNAKGFGDYADGFIPSLAPLEEYEIAGCRVPDDFSRALGDQAESQLAAALTYIETGACPVGATSVGDKSVRVSNGSNASSNSAQELSVPRRMPGRVL